VGSSPAGRAITPGADRLRILIDAPIGFDVPGGTSHAPMIEAWIGGVATRLILDTGSDTHVLTIELARAAGLPADPGEAGTDHAGASVESWTLGPVPGRLGDLAVVLDDAVAITGPAPFEAWGVGGFLSPQRLHPTASAVLDLASDRFFLVDPEGDPDAMATWLTDRSPALKALSLPRVAGEATPVVAGSIDPFPPVPTMLNTGGRGTEFAAAAVPGLSGVEPDRLGHGVGGSAVRGSVAVDRILRVGDATFTVSEVLVRDRIDSMLGLIGMDILRGTVLVVSADEREPVTWMVPR
jgi:hypothetical protein